MRRFSLVFLFSVIGCLFPFPQEGAAAPATGAQTAHTKPLQVIVSIAPQKYMLERIAGDAVAVAVLVKPGADPHSYEPTPTQMRACAEASLYFTIGVPFEEVWLPRIAGVAPNLAFASTIKGINRLSFADDGLLLANARLTRDAAAKAGGSAEGAHKNPAEDHAGAHAAKAPVQEAGKNGAAGPGDIPGYAEHDGHDEHGDHEHGGVDPHVWLSPMLVRQMLPGIARELGKALPEKAAEFRAAAQTFGDELEALDQKLAEKFDAFPHQKRVFLTFHPSWRYYAHNYGLTELTIEVEGKEPGPRAMKTIIDTARAYGITTIFVEPQFPKAAAGAIATNIGAKVVEADPLAEDLPGIYTGMAEKLAASFTK